ncbi:MAG: methyltransferase domain-containing protein [Alistipes sp.]|nr:methyltransferase domain-containing protein [Alistipes sp.]
MGAVQKIVKWALNHIPRPILQRFAGLCVPILGLWYAGKGRKCPICGKQVREFLPYGYGASRRDALCPRCLALERHRLLWLYLERETTLLQGYPTLLHIAPEVALKRQFERHYGKKHADNYLTADLESPLAKLHFDVQDIPLEDESMDVVICNHILEHVEDDRKALRELHRILRKGGWGVVLVPQDYEREMTFEDDSITSPEERARIFGQYDHRRIYGRDYAERVRECGFEVEEIEYENTLSEEERKQYSTAGERLYIIKRKTENQ